MKFTGLLAIGFLMGCGQTARTMVYSDANFNALSAKRNVRVTYVDGRVAHFYRMEIVKVNDTHIFARCWTKQQDEAVDYKFVKSDVVIESVEFSTSRTFTYVAGVVLSIGIIFLLQKIIYGG